MEPLMSPLPNTRSAIIKVEIRKIFDEFFKYDPATMSLICRYPSGALSALSVERAIDRCLNEIQYQVVL